MLVTPRFVLTSLAELAIVVVFAADVLADASWSSSLRVVGVVVALVAAVVVAAVAFQTWSGATERTALLHAAAGAGMLGGACIASAVTSADATSVFGSGALAAVGTAATVCSVLALRVHAARAQGA